MAASDSLGRQFPKHLYHEAPLSARESIRSGGLLPGKGHEMWGRPGEYHAPPGVYMSPHKYSEYGSSMHDSSWFGYDRWRVHTEGLDVRTDPSQPSAAFYTAERIPPEHLTLVKRGHPDWEKHI